MKVDVELVQVGSPKELRQMPIITVRNDKGLLVANLYVLDNGNLHADSWLCNEGWGDK